MYSKKIFLSIFIVLCAALITAACATNASVAGNSNDSLANKEQAEHPVDMGDKDCAACHKDMTPELYGEWEESIHGIAMVKCQVCHGDENNFVVNVPNETCRGCHSNEFNKNPKSDRACSSCHTEHKFVYHQ